MTVKDLNGSIGSGSFIRVSSTDKDELNGYREKFDFIKVSVPFPSNLGLEKSDSCDSYKTIEEADLGSFFKVDKAHSNLRDNSSSHSTSNSSVHLNGKMPELFDPIINSKSSASPQENQLDSRNLNRVSSDSYVTPYLRVQETSSWSSSSQNSEASQSSDYQDGSDSSSISMYGKFFQPPPTSSAPRIDRQHLPQPIQSRSSSPISKSSRPPKNPHSGEINHTKPSVNSNLRVDASPWTPRANSTNSSIYPHRFNQPTPSSHVKLESSSKSSTRHLNINSPVFIKPLSQKGEIYKYESTSKPTWKLNTSAPIPNKPQYNKNTPCAAEKMSRRTLQFNINAPVFNGPQSHKDTSSSLENMPQKTMQLNINAPAFYRPRSHKDESSSLENMLKQTKQLNINAPVFNGTLSHKCTSSSLEGVLKSSSQFNVNAPILCKTQANKDISSSLGSMSKSTNQLDLNTPVLNQPRSHDHKNMLHAHENISKKSKQPSTNAPNLSKPRAHKYVYSSAESMPNSANKLNVNAPVFVNPLPYNVGKTSNQAFKGPSLEDTFLAMDIESPHAFNNIPVPVSISRSVFNTSAPEFRPRTLQQEVPNCSGTASTRSSLRNNGSSKSQLDKRLLSQDRVLSNFPVPYQPYLKEKSNSFLGVTTATPKTEIVESKRDHEYRPSISKYLGPPSISPQLARRMVRIDASVARSVTTKKSRPRFLDSHEPECPKPTRKYLFRDGVSNGSERKSPSKSGALDQSVVRQNATTKRGEEAVDSLNSEVYIGSFFDTSSSLPLKEAPRSTVLETPKSHNDSALSGKGVEKDDITFTTAAIGVQTKIISERKGREDPWLEAPVEHEQDHWSLWDEGPTKPQKPCSSKHLPPRVHNTGFSNDLLESILSPHDSSSFRFGKEPGGWHEPSSQEAPIKGSCIQGTWKVVRQIGRGSFGEVFLAINTTNPHLPPVAVKRESAVNNPPRLATEMSIYRTLAGYDRIPTVHYYGLSKDRHILVMDLLGPTIKSLRAFSSRIRLSAVLEIGIQLISIMEYIHTKGIAYRDVKPDNFLLGLDCASFSNSNSKVELSASAQKYFFESSSYEPSDELPYFFDLPHRPTTVPTVYAVDFGLSEMFKDPSKQTELSQGSKVRKRTGTAKYASLATHRGFIAGPLDDLESIGYVLIDLLNGELPWDKAVSGARSNSVWHSVERVKRRIRLPSLCHNLPEGFISYFTYLRQASRYETPDYKFLRSIISDIYLEKHPLTVLQDLSD